MRKFILAGLVSVMALSVASTAFAGQGRGNGNGFERGNGLKRGWFKWHRGWERGMWGFEKQKTNVFGECKADARADMNTALKAAFTELMDDMKEARETRDEAIDDADGTQSKIDDAWEAYRDDVADAWKTYGDATADAFGDYGTAIGKCPIPTPTPDDEEDDND